MSETIGTWGEKHIEPFVGPARRSFDQEYDKSSAFEYTKRSFARPQPWRTYPVLGGETGDELDPHPLIKEQRDKLLPNKSLNPEYNRYFDEKQSNEKGHGTVREDHLALFSPQTRKVRSMSINSLSSSFHIFRSFFSIWGLNQAMVISIVIMKMINVIVFGVFRIISLPMMHVRLFH